MAFQGPNWKPAKGSSRLNRKARDAEADRLLEAAYEEVNIRDANVCRVTGRHVSAGAVMAEVRREHHHLRPRSIAPERVADPTNIILVCAEAHELITGGFIEVEGDDATKPGLLPLARGHDARAGAALPHRWQEDGGMSVRERIQKIQKHLRDGALTPDMARESLVQLTALLGNVNDAQRAADHDYKVVLLKAYESEETANRAKIRAETSPEYQLARETHDTEKLVIEMIRSLKAYMKSLDEEMRNAPR